ncbi:unnamed protein product, partial [Mesorhabditis belari]|uniref:Uncharacterized protein n=1 Tax=Mesorhabditis belari TaxID=2138241 RepID=A0AAF3ECN0_9BILA
MQFVRNFPLSAFAKRFTFTKTPQLCARTVVADAQFGREKGPPRSRYSVRGGPAAHRSNFPPRKITLIARHFRGQPTICFFSEVTTL